MFVQGLKLAHVRKLAQMWKFCCVFGLRSMTLDWANWFDLPNYCDLPNYLDLLNYLGLPNYLDLIYHLHHYLFLLRQALQTASGPKRL